MDHFAGLDVSVKETSVGIVEDTGRIVREVKVASEPEALLPVLKNPAYHFKRIGLEAGPLSQWLFSALAEAGLPVICVETRHMRPVLKDQINKTDRNAARCIAQMMRAGLYRPVHVKTLHSQKLRMLLTHRKLLQSKAIAVDNDLRGTLRNFGLRVRPISSSRITEFSQHEANGCEAQEDQAAEVEIFPVLGKPAATIEPRNGALDDPSTRQNDEAFGPIGTLDDCGFELRSDLGQRRMEDRPRIGAIGKEPFQKRKQAEKRGQQHDAAVAILNIGRMNNRVQQQTLCIYQNMPLLALDEFARVEPGRIDAGAAFFGAFHTLAVDDGGGGTGFASRLLATLLVKRVVDAIQRAVVPPQTEVPIHGAARRQVLGDVAPLASRAQHIHDAVDDIPRVHFTLAAPALRRRNERPDMRPFFVRHIARISQMIALVARPVLARPHPQPSSQAADV